MQAISKPSDNLAKNRKLCQVFSVPLVVNILKESLNQPRINSVFHWGAQFDELCAALCRVLPEKFGSGEILRKELAGRSDLAAVLYFQVYYNLRISEALSIQGTDIDSVGRIFVKGAKGSEGVVILDPISVQFCRDLHSKPVQLFSGLDRFFVYRIYRKLGVQVQSSGRVNCAVTHAFRHINTARARAAGMEPDMIKTQLHHRSKKSQSYYGTKEQGRK